MNASLSPVNGYERNLGVALGSFMMLLAVAASSQSSAHPSLVTRLGESGITAAGPSFGPGVSQNGEAIVFLSTAPNLTALPTDPSSLQVYLGNLSDDQIQLVSVNDQGTSGGNGTSAHPVISSNGVLVCFASQSSDVAGVDTNGTTDIFLRNVAEATTTLISVNRDGTAAGQGRSSRPAMTPDGRWIVFVSDAPDLVADDTNGIPDVFIRDLTANETHLVSVDALPPLSARDPMLNGISVSADGMRVSFGSRAGGHHPLVATNTPGEIYMRDLALGQTWWASSNKASFLPDAEPEAIRAFDAAIAPDGQSVVYKAQPNAALDFENLNPGVVLLHHDLAANETTLLATNAQWETTLSWSGDSQWLTFATTTDVLLWHRDTAQTQVISVDETGGNPGNGPSHTPVISADGTKIAFLSAATDLTTNETPGTFQVYLRDLAAETTVLVSANGDGVAGDRDHVGTVPSLDRMGQWVGFDSESGNLAPDDWNRSSDVFLRSMNDGAAELVSRAADETTAPTTGLTQKILPLREFTSRDGRYLAFLSPDEVYNEDDTNGYHDVFVRDLWENTTLALGRLPGGGFPQDLLSGDPIITADGGQVFFTRRPFAFATASPPGEMEIWQYNLRNGSSSLVRTVTQNYWDVVHSGRGQFHNLLSANDDGSKLTYVDEDAVWVEDVLSGERLKISPSMDESPFDPRFSPQFVPQRDMIFFLARVDSSNQREAYVRLLSESTNRLVSAYSPSDPYIQWTGLILDSVFSSDGQWLALHGMADTDYSSFYGEIIALANLEFTTNIQILCADCRSPSLSGDGGLIVYEQNETYADIVLRDLRLGTTNVVSVNRFGTNTLNAVNRSSLITHDGRYVVFASNHEEFVEGDANGMMDVFVRDLALQETFLFSQNRFGTGSGNGPSLNPVLAADGRTVFFESFAGDLVEGDYNAHRDIFMLRLGSEDSDEDGMDDDFEYAYFGTLERDGAGDHDGDGHTDLQEFQAGTSPTNEESILRVMTLSMAGSDSTRILWASVPGKTYRVQWRSGFEASSTDWTDLSGDVVASAATATKTDDGAAGQGRRFYRVLLVP